MEYQSYKMEHLKAENARLEEVSAQTVRESSKMLVSGNPGAKATHLNNIKMELTTVKKTNHRLEDQIRAHEKKEDQMMTKIGRIYQDLISFALELEKSCSNENAQNVRVMPQKTKLQNADAGLMRITELVTYIKECFALISPDMNMKEGPGTASKSSAKVNMSFGSQQQASSKNFFSESTQKYNNSKK